MAYDPARHHRRSIRLKGYDYSRAGAYFVTILVNDRERLLGDVVNGRMRLSQIGQIVADAWRWLAAQYPYVTLDEWILMPDHLHGIIILDDPASRKGGSRAALTDPESGPASTAAGPCGADSALTASESGPASTAAGPCGAEDESAAAGAAPAARRKPLGQLVGAFKTVSTKRVNALRQTPGARLWHRDFYERIIRDERALRLIRAYIIQNPSRWSSDRSAHH